MKNLICLFTLLAGINGFSQNIDSLWRISNNIKQADTSRLKAMHAIANIYRDNKPDSCIILAELELTLATSLSEIKGQIKEGKKYQSKAFNIMGVAFRNKGDYPKAIEYYLKAIKLREEIGDKNGVGMSYTNIGVVYHYQANYPQALSYYLKALKLKEEVGDKEGIGACYIAIGIVYKEQKNFSKALDYYFKAIKLQEGIGDKSGIGACYSNVGVIYKEQNNLSKALDYYFKAAKIFEEIDDKQSIGACYSNIGLVYQNQSSFPKALEYYLKALKLKEEIGDIQGIETCYLDLSSLYNSLANYKLAIQYGNQALKLSIELGDVDGERYAQQYLAEAYSYTGKYKEAFESYVRFKTLTDTIFNAENSRQLGDMKTNFEVQKKEAELKAKADAQELVSVAEKQKQRIVLILVCVVLSLVAVFSALLYKRFKLTEKQKNIIEVKERETQIQKHLIEEKHKEITDSINYAERIQRSFIATKEILDENLNDYFVLFKPKDIVSGDFYWASKLNNGNFALVTADSTGHGVPGAIMSLLNITSLEKAIETLTLPSEILNSTRKTIIDRLKKDGSLEGGKDGMDASLTVYDFVSKKLIISAANNPVWIVRGAETIEIKPDKMPIGKHDNDTLSFTEQEITIQSGDVIYTLTDGYPDQFGGEKGKKFMSKNLRELLVTNSHLPMQEQKEILEKVFSNWVGDLEQVDDVTIIGVRI